MLTWRVFVETVTNNKRAHKNYQFIQAGIIVAFKNYYQFNTQL